MQTTKGSKEAKEALDEYCLKALAASKSGDTHNQEDSIPSSKELYKNRISLGARECNREAKDHSFGGEWIKAQEDKLNAILLNLPKTSFLSFD